MALKSVLTHDGTSEIHTLVIGQALTGIPAFRGCRRTLAARPPIFTPARRHRRDRGLTGDPIVRRSADAVREAQKPGSRRWGRR